MPTNSSATPRYGLPIYTTSDYADSADVPVVLNENSAKIEEVLGNAEDRVDSAASAIAQSQLTATLLLMGS